VKEKTGDLNPRIAIEGIAEVTIFPARIGLDHQHLELLGTNREFGAPEIVLHDGLALDPGDIEFEPVVPGFFGTERQPQIDGPHRRDHHRFSRDLGIVHEETDLHGLVPRQGALTS